MGPSPHSFGTQIKGMKSLSREGKVFVYFYEGLSNELSANGFPPRPN